MRDQKGICSTNLSKRALVSGVIKSTAAILIPLISVLVGGQVFAVPVLHYITY